MVFIIKRVKNQHLYYILSFKTIKNKTFIFNNFFSKASHKRLLKKVLPTMWPCVLGDINAWHDIKFVQSVLMQAYTHAN